MTVDIVSPDGTKSRAEGTFKPDGTASRGQGSLDVRYRLDDACPANEFS